MNEWQPLTLPGSAKKTLFNVSLFEKYGYIHKLAHLVNN